MARFDLKKLQGYLRRSRDDLLAGLTLDRQPRDIITRGKKYPLGKMFNFDCYVRHSRRYGPWALDHLPIHSPFHRPPQARLTLLAGHRRLAAAERCESGLTVLHPRGVT
jgi:hypothetical protein